MLFTLALAQFAMAGDDPDTMTWVLTSEGVEVGTRTLTLHYLGGAEGQAATARVLETFTELRGLGGDRKFLYRHRVSAHASGQDPAAFHATVELGGVTREVQGRWTGSVWTVTTTTLGKTETVELPADEVDLSTADLMDPFTGVPVSQLGHARILSTSTGRVQAGPVEKLGVVQLHVGGTSVEASGYGWSSPEGRTELHYSPDGFLVHAVEPFMGFRLVATLQGAPPSGIDDFPVVVGSGVEAH